MTNFKFLSPDWPELLEDAFEAERNGLYKPRTAGIYARRALELAVRWVFENDSKVVMPYEDNLRAMIHEYTFRQQLPLDLWDHIRYVWKFGNQCVHEGRKIGPPEGAEAVRSLYNFLAWFASTYTDGGLTIAPFDLNLIPDPKKIKELQQAKATETKEQMQMLEASLREKDEARVEAEKKAQQSQEEVENLRAEIQAIKSANQAQVTALNYSEATNRAYLIDPMLREAGWNPELPNVREFEVAGMPSSSGVGFVDYVLWDADGLPLAVVEAKKTQISAETGKHQAKLYADCLEARYGRRPLIYFTNGYRTHFWDDKAYPPRLVSGFHTREEMAMLLRRRTEAGNLPGARISRSIVERPYQERAIKLVADRFQVQRGRGALLVMATGTGKTRVSVALVKILMEMGWVKRVLFLADRRALLRQANKAYAKFLPDSSRGILMEGGTAPDARVVFSTYPTMMNAIDKWDSDGKREFSIGDFDLVIIDEAHRSIYQKFKAIFEYFDSLLLGLTATPRSDVDRNTYELFGLEPGIPTHAYELQEAVNEGYLVPFRAYSVPLKFPREGIKYDDLSPEEKEEYESQAEFYDEQGELMPEQSNLAINEWLFNTDTVDKALKTLMESGIKVAGGGKLGKTIIFARNHRHAEFIVARFDLAYPQLKGHFCQVVHNKTRYVDDLIDNFGVAENQPTIAVSVDMLDTGIDVPEIVNLVFFKLVRSKTKFWQMIGRGTRLCPDLFGPGQNKTHFAVFDFCQNLEYFQANPDGQPTSVQKSVRELTIKARIELLRNVSQLSDYEEFRKQVNDDLHKQIEGLNFESFVVRPHEEIISPFRVREKWDSLTQADMQTVELKIGSIPAMEAEDEMIRRFDLVVIKLEIAILTGTTAQESLIRTLKELASELLKKSAVPAVAAQIDLIRDLTTTEFWQNVTVPELDAIRLKIRKLVVFVEKESRGKLAYTTFGDELGELVEVQLLTTDAALAGYREKVRFHLRTHLQHPAVRKIRENVPLTQEDVTAIEALLFGDQIISPEILEDVIKDEGPLPLFVRKTVGLEKEAAKRAFSEIFADANLSARQLQFLDEIINYLSINGVMAIGNLYDPPFTHHHDHGLDGILPNHASAIQKIIEQISSLKVG